MARIPNNQFNSVAEAVLANKDAENLLLDLRENAIAAMNAYIPVAGDPNGFLLHQHKARVEVYTYLLNLGEYAKKQNMGKNNPLKKGA